MPLWVVTTIMDIDFHDLPIVYVSTKRLLYSFHVGAESIGGDLNAVCHAVSYVLHELISLVPPCAFRIGRGWD